MRRGLLIAALVLIAESSAAAQCRVNSSSNEGKLLAFYTAPIVFSMATAPEVLPSASIRLGAEGEYIPKPDPAIERTGLCFTQKSEHTSLSPVFGRPRITLGGPFGFALELAYLPPVTIARATPIRRAAQSRLAMSKNERRGLALSPSQFGSRSRPCSTHCHRLRVTVFLKK